MSRSENATRVDKRKSLAEEQLDGNISGLSGRGTRAVRAFYYELLDLFARVPLVISHDTDVRR